MFPTPSEPPSTPSRSPLAARLHVAAGIARCPLAVVYRIEGGEAWFVEAHGEVALVHAMPVRVPAWRLRRDAVALVSHVGWRQAPESALLEARLGLGMLVSVPLHRGQEQVGAVILAGRPEDAVAGLDLGALDAVGELILDALLGAEQSAVRATDSLPPGIAEQAAWPVVEYAHDPVTGLPDRAVIEEATRLAIDAAAVAGAQVAVATVCFDRFQRIDDSLGRAVSDELMRQCAERILETTGDVDLVGREGDEFFVVFTGLAPGRSPLAHVHRLTHSFQQPFHVHGYELFITPRIGVSRYPDDATDVPLLFRFSGIALRRARIDRRPGLLQCFTDDLREAVEQRGDLERRLRRALSAGELLLHYQPKVELPSRRTRSVEALIRWRRDGALVSPGQFLPVAEESELIVPIGAWVMLEACRQMQRWRRRGVALESVSVNVSALQFARPDFVDSVRRILRSTGLSPESLELEVTETSLMDDVGVAAEKLGRLRQIGVRVSVDDFGTGYSSLAYLSQLPVDVLKIDRSFVKDLDGEGSVRANAHALTEAINGLGHSLGLSVLAEGVETEEQLAALSSLGCDAAQGYLFSKPVPADDIDRLV